MKLTITKQTVWAAPIPDEPGALAAALEPLAEAGADLEFVISRRHESGGGVVFVTPLRGAKQSRAAASAGFQKTERLHALRVEGTNRPGLGAKVTRAIADAGISMRGFSAAALGRRAVLNLAFDTANDANRARRDLARM